MRKSLLRRPSPALVVSFVALLVALGGTAYAGLSIPKNSVGTKQLKNGAVTTKKIKNGTVTASKINTSGLTVPNALQAKNATSAANATTASNASALGGAPASAYAASTQMSFIAPTLNSPYSNMGSGYTTAGYMKDSLGFVHLEGVMNCPTGTTHVAFTLPAGFRPSENVDAAGGNEITGGSEVFVLSNGEVITGAGGTATGCSLDGITFPAAGVAGT